MKPLFSVLVAAAILLFLVLAFDMMKKGAKKESFDNSGALMQLASSHVPTEEDVGEMRQYRRQVRHDLVDMTGGY
jgi:hypothetical protein